MVLVVPPGATPECTGLLFPCLPVQVREPGGHLLKPQELEWRGLKGTPRAQGSPWHRGWRLWGMQLGEGRCPPSGDGDVGLPRAGTDRC